MDDRIFVKPNQPEGEPPLKVRKPVNGHLAEGGEWMPKDSYWLRRLADGDVVEAKPPTEAAAPATTPAKAADKAAR